MGSYDETSSKSQTSVLPGILLVQSVLRVQYFVEYTLLMSLYEIHFLHIFNND